MHFQRVSFASRGIRSFQYEVSAMTKLRHEMVSRSLSFIKNFFHILRPWSS